MERFTISLDDRLAQQFDDWMSERSYANRSEAVRDLLRAELGKSTLRESAGKQCVACLSYVYNHHEHGLGERLAAMLQEQHPLTISTMRAQLDRDHCLETVMLRGLTSAVTQFADELCAQRGVHHGQLNIISVELHPTPPQGRQRAAKSAGVKPAI